MEILLECEDGLNGGILIVSDNKLEKRGEVDKS